MDHHDHHIRLSEIQLKTLTKKIKTIIDSQTWFQKHGSELFVFGCRIFGFIASLFLFSLEGVIPKLIALVPLSYFYYGIGITATHETSHRSFFKHNKLNAWVAYLVSDVWSAQSNLWWHYRHVQKHHMFTNMKEKEALSFHIRINKYLYFFVIPFFVTGWLIAHSVYFLKSSYKSLAIYLACMLSGFFFHFWMFSFFVSFGWAVVATLVMRSLFAPIFLHLALFNHIDLAYPTVREAWIPHQTKTTRNLKSYWLLNGMGGNAFTECHIEHHLFPSLSNRMLMHIKPIVKTYLEEEGYAYHEQTYTECLRHCLQQYDTIFGKEAIADMV